MTLNDQYDAMKDDEKNDTNYISTYLDNLENYFSFDMCGVVGRHA